MSGKSMEYNGKMWHLIDENEYRNHKARNQFYTGLVLKNDGTLVMVNEKLTTIGIATGDILPGIPGVTTIVAEPDENPIYDPLLVEEAKRLLEIKWYNPLSSINDWTSLTASGVEYIPFMLKTIKNAELTAKMSNMAKSVSSLGKTVGTWSTVVGLSLDIGGLVQYSRDRNSDNALSPSKFGLNLGVTLYSVWFPYIGIGYFGLETFYPGGTKQFIKDGSAAQDVENERNARNGGNAWTRPRIIPWGVK